MPPSFLTNMQQATKRKVAQHGGGYRVRLRFHSGAERVFEITNQSQLVAPEKGIISQDSPLAQALQDAHVGDTVRYKVGENTLTVHVLEVLA